MFTSRERSNEAWGGPMGSPKSRAAARMLAQQKRDVRQRLEIVINIPRPRADNTKPDATPWIGDYNGSGKLVRTLYVPDGMSVEDARRIVDEGRLGECREHKPGG